MTKLNNSKLSHLINASKTITVLSVTIGLTFLIQMFSTLAESSREIRGLGNRCIDVAGNEVGTAKGNPSPLILFPCHDGKNQHWKFLSDGTIRGEGGRCIDIAGGEVVDKNGNSARLILFPCRGGDNQKWNFPSDGTIRGLGNRCIDVAGDEVEDKNGNPSSLILFPCAGRKNQQWHWNQR